MLTGDEIATQLLGSDDGPCCRQPLWLAARPLQHGTRHDAAADLLWSHAQRPAAASRRRLPVRSHCEGSRRITDTDSPRMLLSMNQALALAETSRRLTKFRPGAPPSSPFIESGLTTSPRVKSLSQRDLELFPTLLTPRVRRKSTPSDIIVPCHVNPPRSGQGNKRAKMALDCAALLRRPLNRGGPSKALPRQLRVIEGKALACARESVTNVATRAFLADPKTAPDTCPSCD
jgi:hypothetical protein